MLGVWQKWFWLKSRVTDCDSSRVESTCKKGDLGRVFTTSILTWLESTHQKSWLESSHWLESLYRRFPFKWIPGENLHPWSLCLAFWR